MKFNIIYFAVFVFQVLECSIAAPTLDNQTVNELTVVCNDNSLLTEIKKIFDKVTPGIKHLGDIPAYAATSCQQIATLRPDSKSGYYWIQEPTRPAHVYCQLNDAPFGEEGVWMKIADVNMTKTSSKCPSGLEKVTSPKSLCRKRVDRGCSSAVFSTHNVPYKRVCGKVIGYQYYSTDGFHPYYSAQSRTIDELYVEGVSITHSHNPRHHIWTLAAGLEEDPRADHSVYRCPCSTELANVPFTGLIPDFIGDDYYCDTGSRTAYQNRYYLDDPLWDGQGCGRFSTCCEGNKKPWFCKELPEPVDSDIEVRLCCDESRSSDEDVLLEAIELYVQ